MDACYWRDFILNRNANLVYNVITRLENGSIVEDELAEAAALQRVSKKRVAGEGWHTWLERKPVKLTIVATIAILNWWYCTNCTNNNGKI